MVGLLVILKIDNYMLLNKVRENGIDLFIKVIDDIEFKYEANEFMYHADYNTFQLVFKFEDYTKIINDGKEHMYIIAEYVNAGESVLCKCQSEDFDELLDMIKEWNDTNKIV